MITDKIFGILNANKRSPAGSMVRDENGNLLAGTKVLFANMFNLKYVVEELSSVRIVTIAGSSEKVDEVVLSLEEFALLKTV